MDLRIAIPTYLLDTKVGTHMTTAAMTEIPVRLLAMDTVPRQLEWQEGEETTVTESLVSLTMLT